MIYKLRLGIDEKKIEVLIDPDGYEKEVKELDKKKIEYPEKYFVGDIEGKSVYFIDGYFYVEGLEKAFISEEDIYDYFE